MATKAKAPAGGRVTGNTLFVTLPLEPQGSSQRGNVMLGKTSWLKADGLFNGKPVVFTITAIESKR